MKKVTLIANAPVNGRRWPAGTDVEVDEEQEARLRAAGAIETDEHRRTKYAELSASERAELTERRNTQDELTALVADVSRAKKMLEAALEQAKEEAAQQRARAATLEAERNALASKNAEIEAELAAAKELLETATATEPVDPKAAPGPAAPAATTPAEPEAAKSGKRGK